MNKVNFAIALHFHQPVGNFDEVFERACQNCYKPFLEHLLRYPDIQATLHISGSLIDYIIEKHPEIIELAGDMVRKGQIEMMGGCYYEPIIAAIPPRDIKGQMKFMSKRIKEIFDYEPKGAWMPERVWQHRLTKHLHQSGMQYCILDDTHLMKNGVKKEDIHNYFMAKYGLHQVAIFPSDKHLRYTIPFKPVSETIEYFRDIASKKDEPLFVYGDDGEKFGEWPKTNEWVYKKGWLKNFFDALTENKDWIRTVKLSDYLKSHQPFSTVHIPESSYEEMMEWSDGSWFNFLKKYPESNHMHKKMEYVSSKVDAIERKIRKDKEDSLHWAKVELYRGQCNCGYWHGVFGGLYMFHLRNAIYNHLIAAENLVDAATYRRENEWVEIKRFGFNQENKDEFTIESNHLSLYVDTKEGGIIKEVDYRPICANLVNGLSRRKERYHHKMEPELKEKLVYDKYPRYCLRDYFVSDNLKKEEFASSSFTDFGGFSNGQYTAKRKKDGLILKRKSSISGAEVELTKDITVKGSIIEVSYNIKTSDPEKMNLLFGTDFNLTMPFLNSERYHYFSDGKEKGLLNASGVVGDVSSFGIMDYGDEVDIRFDFSQKPKALWYFPVETISQSQVEYRSNFQCSCIFPMWKPEFNKEKTWHFTIAWYIDRDLSF